MSIRANVSILANPLQEYLSFCSPLFKNTKGKVTIVTTSNGYDGRSPEAKLMIREYSSMRINILIYKN